MVKAPQFFVTGSVEFLLEHARFFQPAFHYLGEDLVLSHQVLSEIELDNLLIHGLVWPEKTPSLGTETSDLSQMSRLHLCQFLETKRLVLTQNHQS